VVAEQKQRITIPVSGMHCAACVSKVESALGDLPGVEQAQANLAASSAAVVCDLGQLSLPAVEEAVRGVGYQVPWERLELLVLGMMGTHCEEIITRAVGELPGVVRVQVNLGTDTVSVEYASSLASSGKRSARPSVGMASGAMQLTRMRCGASSSAKVRVRLTIAAL